jgi:hypothetical protein
VPEQATGGSLLAFGVTHLDIAAQADDKGDPLFLEPGKKGPAPELSIRAQAGYALGAKDAKVAREQGFPLVQVRVAGFAQHRPKQGEGHSPMHRRQDQQVQFGLAEFPVGAVQCQNERRFEPDAPRDRDNQTGQAGTIQIKTGDEATQALVVTLWFGFSGQGVGVGKPRQAHGSAGDQGDEESRQKADAGAIPSCRKQG